MSLQSTHNFQLSGWLKLCLALVFMMILLGGATRLTGSGLSMVTWHPAGMLPPLDQLEWEREFEQYQQYPEYQVINRDMTLGGFKRIYWFEYSHRQLGRLIGLVFLFPFLYFWLRQMIPPGLAPRLLLMLILGGAQGVLGWYMVQSGLVNNPQVSQYRLTAHLLSALLIYGFILWTILGLDNARPYQPLARSLVAGWRKVSTIMLALVVLTIASGGLVAGLKAGKIFNSFPLMGGQLVPEGIGALTPWYLNLFENKVTVQFDHRWLAVITGISLLVWYWKGRNAFDDFQIQRSFKWIGMMVLIQLALGIATLIFQVPVVLGILHQAGALVLFSAVLLNVHRLSRN